MSWLEKIRNKPHREKIRYVWLLTLIAFLILICLWALTSRIGSRRQRDLTLFQTLGRGLKDFKDNFRK